MYINPKFQLNRRFFYYIFGVLIITSLYGIFIKDTDHDSFVIYIHVLINSVLYLVVGAVMIHTTTLRDKLFRVNICPYCGNRTWDARRRLKMNHNVPESCKCTACKKAVRTKNWPTIFFLLSLFVFLLSGSLSGSNQAAYIITEIYLFSVVIIFVRNTPLTVQRSLKNS